MKSTKDERVVKKDEYPCLKTSAEGLVVLFSAPDEGTVVCDATSLYEVGDFVDNWGESDFTTYYGTITLEN